MKKTIAILSIICVALAVCCICLVIDRDEVKEPDDVPYNGEEKIPSKEEEKVIIQEKPVESNKYDSKPVKATYDVIVFGAEPEGIVAAISAARNGLKVLLTEKRDGPGGLMTYGMLNTIDMNINSNGVLLSQGIFEEFFEQVGNKNSFDVKRAKKAFEDMLNNEKNIVQIYNVSDIIVSATSNAIKYVVIDGEKYEAHSYIDCTQDADVSVKAGVKYTIGWEDVNEKNRSMSATLVMKMDDVDWNKIRSTIEKQGLPNTGCTEDSAWAFGEITKTYVPKQTHMRLKALNLGLQEDGSVLINSLQILNVNMLDEEARETAYSKCKTEANYVAEFLKKNVPGFENAKLSMVAPELYVRETRHILGEYKLTVTDMLESTYYTNAIAMASYPIDVQTTSIYDWGYIIGAPNQYYIPMGVIIPQGFTNLLTIGRSGSYTSIAAGSARVIPTGMTLAQSAGIMTAIAIEKDTDFQKMLSSISICQDVVNRMKLQKMYMDNKSKPVVDVNGQYYDFIIEMCEKGILSLGYGNTFNANEIVSEREFIILTKTYLKRSFIREELWSTDHINLLDAGEYGATPNRAKEIIYDITTYNLKDEEDKKKIEDYLNLIIPTSSTELSLVRVYEILISFKNYIVRQEI